MELLALILEVVFELFGEFLLELVWASVKEAFGRENHRPELATFGYLVLGAAAGALAAWVHPGRLLSNGPIPGLSLVVAPLLGGAAMHLWGKYRRARGHGTTNLATFYGGAAFLLGVAVARFVGTL